MTFVAYVHNPTPALAIQVVKPWVRLQQALPYSHQVKAASGALRCIILQKPGEVEVQRAYPGDWIVKLEDGRTVVLHDEVFQQEYSLPADPGDEIPAMSLAQEAQIKEILNAD